MHDLTTLSEMNKQADKKHKNLDTIAGHVIISAREKELNQLHDRIITLLNTYHTIQTVRGKTERWGVEIGIHFPYYRKHTSEILQIADAYYQEMILFISNSYDAYFWEVKTNKSTLMGKWAIREPWDAPNTLDFTTFPGGKIGFIIPNNK